MNSFASLGCTSCHSGAAFNGPQMPEGNNFFMKFPTFADNAYVKKYDLLADKGRADVTGNEADAYFFKVPTLRNVALTAPYFHNGRVDTLDKAVKVMAKTQLNIELDKAQTEDLVAFLKALTGEFPEIVMPRLPPTEGWHIETE
jgi:cytochrome c peroxidase